MGSIQEQDTDRLHKEALYLRSTLQSLLINSARLSGLWVFLKVMCQFIQLKEESWSSDKSLYSRLKYVAVVESKHVIYNI